MKRTILFLLALSSTVFLHAQIGVNTSTPQVSFDVQAGATDATTAEGMSAPRLTLSQLASKDAKYATDQTGALVYVTDVTGTPTAKTRNVIAKGYYYFDGALWQTGGPDQSLRFLYMPTIVVPISTTDPTYNPTNQTFTLDLYSMYSVQYGMTSMGASVKSPTATTLPVLANGNIEYLITYYDNTVYQNVGVTNAGILTYQLAPVATPTDKTYMNILFKVKQN